MQMYLQTFFYVHYPNISFNDLFGGSQKLVLRTITVKAHEDGSENLRILAPDNFTALPAIEHLTLADCGIEAILNHTFDYIGETLRFLDLNQNAFMELEPKIFYTLLDSYRFDNVRIAGNVMECNCRFYALRDLIRMNAHKRLYFKPITCIQSHARNFTIDECTHLQVINMKRLNIEMYLDYNVNWIAYRKFFIKYKPLTKQIMVQVENIERYRILIINQNFMWTKKSKGQRCYPNQQCLANLTNCFLVTADNANFSIAKYFPDSDLISLAVIHVSASKRIWPLHYVTVRIPDELTGCIRITWLETFFIGAFALIIGIFMILFLGSLILKNDNE